MKGLFLNSIISIDNLIQENPYDRDKMKLLYEVIQEYLDKMISDRRKRINKLNDNFNILYAKSERDELSTLFEDITQINQLKKEVAKVMQSISLYE